jgi:hypothetical protein
MSRSRRVFNKEFKAKVVLEPLKEKKSTEIKARSERWQTGETKSSFYPIKFQCRKSESKKNI